MLDTMLFIVFPYIALALAIFGSLFRWIVNPFSFTTKSSQLLESRMLFWGSVMFHFSILFTVFSHVTATFFPSMWKMVADQHDLHTVITYIGGGVAVTIVISVGILIVRRGIIREVHKTSTIMDGLVLLVLLTVVTLGALTVFLYENGAVYFYNHASPWLQSLLMLSPQVNTLESVPWLVRFHFIFAFIFISLFPFSRLVHILTIPVSYLWRKYIIYIWNRKPHLPYSNQVIQRGEP